MAVADGGGPDHRELLGDLGCAVLAAALTLAVTAAALGLWSWHPSVPLSYATDALYYDGVVKATLDHGWYLQNPDLGAPFGLESHDFPVVSNDSLQLLLVKFIGLFVDRPFLVSNIFFVLTFPLNALGAFVALRWRRVPRQLAVVGSVAFGLLPLHFMKGIDYLFFVSSYMVPIGCAMVLTVLADEPLVAPRESGRRWRGLVAPRTAVFLLLCAAIASASIYYAVFASILLVAAALAAGVVHRSRRALAEGMAGVAAIGSFVVLNQLPTILYRLEHGPNSLVAARNPGETEFYGLKLIQLVLPAPGHRIGFLADITDRYRNTSLVLGEPSTSIGLLASVGLAWLLVVALASTLGSSRSSAALAEERRAGFSVVLGLLWATTGGVAAVVSYTVTPQLRAWGRMSVFIAFFGLVGTMGLLARIGRRVGTPAGHAAFKALLASLLVVVALDQTTPSFAPDRLTIEREYRSDANFVRQIEDQVPAGSAILQLPYVAYPEVPPTYRLGVYDQLRPYMHSERLRWSFGAMKGRPEDWHAHMTDAPLRSLLAGAVAGGMTGLVVDRFGYADDAAALEAELREIVGPPTGVAETGRMLFWDLRPLRARLREAGQPVERLSELALRPIRLSFGDGFYAEEAIPGMRWRWSQERGTVSVDNPGPEPREVIFSVNLRTSQPGEARTTLRLPDGSTSTIDDPGPQGAVVRQRVRVPSGRSWIRLESTAQASQGPRDSRRLVAQLVDPVVVPVELCAAAAVLGAQQGQAGCLDSSRAHRP